MNISQQIAKHFREVFFGGNWTSVNLKDTVADVNWEQAVTKVHDRNTIVTLVYHINYFVSVTLKVLEGEALNGNDTFSFDHPPIQSQQDWENMLNRVWDEAEKFAALIEQLPDNQLSENLADEKYGTYYRNLPGIVEHTHYHLGQIVIIEKVLAWQ